jgi:8-oxo-dGTP diphosphatase
MASRPNWRGCNALSGGLRLLQVRDKTLPPAQRTPSRARSWRSPQAATQAVVLINDDQELARAVGAHGLHLSSQRLWQIDRGRISRASPPRAMALPICAGGALGLDFVVLGPVLPTASHPGATGIGWPEFSRLSNARRCRSMRSAGMQPEMLETARRSGGARHRA